ncbi:hypothetical protein OSTOST_01492, partial [Ostertagia ostertagi]
MASIAGMTDMFESYVKKRFSDVFYYSMLFHRFQNITDERRSFSMLTFIDTNQRKLPRSISFDGTTKLLDPNGNLILPSPQATPTKSRTPLRNWFISMKTRRNRLKIAGSTEDLLSLTSSDDKSL